MKHKVIKLYPLLCLCLAIIFANQIANAQTAKKLILQKCEQYFGEPLDGALNLFEVNKKFVIHPIFDEKGNLTEIAVEPTGFFEGDHADWSDPKETVLTKVVFEDIIAKIKSFSRFGMLLGKEKNSFTTNSIVYSNEYYKNVFVKYGEWFESDKPADNDHVRFIYFYFFREITVKIDNKKHCQFCTGYQYLVNAGEESFFVEKTTYDKLKSGKTVTFRGVLASGVNFETFGTKLKPIKLPTN